MSNWFSMDYVPSTDFASTGGSSFSFDNGGVLPETGLSAAGTGWGGSAAGDAGMAGATQSDAKVLNGKGSTAQKAGKLAEEYSARAAQETNNAAKVDMTPRVDTGGYTLGGEVLGGVGMPGLTGSLTDNYKERKQQMELLKQQNASRFGGFN